MNAETNQNKYPKTYRFMVGTKYLPYLVQDQPSGLSPDEKIIVDDFRDFCLCHYGRGHFRSQLVPVCNSICHISHTTAKCTLVEYIEIGRAHV